jgi:CO/xanthine dehydrogenase FAD-binding subunit
MPHRLREYHRPADLQTALSLLQSPDHQALSVGPRPALEPFANTEAVVDLSSLNLNYITETADTISIGAQTPVQAIVESPVLRHLANALLPQAVKYVAHLGLRNVATLGAEAIPEIEFDQTANLTAEAGHDRLVAGAGADADADADAEPIPELEFDQTVGW